MYICNYCVGLYDFLCDLQAYDYGIFKRPKCKSKLCCQMEAQSGWDLRMLCIVKPLGL